MAEKIAFENGQISKCEGLVTLTLTLDGVILHTIVHHSSTTTYMPSSIEIEETFCGHMDVCPSVRAYVLTYVCTDGWTFETGFIKSTLSKSRPKIHTND